MSSLYELYVTLGIDKDQFDRGIAEAKKQTLGFGDTAKSVFTGSLLADFVKQAASATLSFAKDSLAVASDLQEVQNVVDVTFGDGASQIDAWAKAAKTAFGMGELSAKRFAGTMGAMLKSMGMTDAETMDMSTNLVKLAGDMASFYNLDHETAFEKIRSGISGETEPLKQLGINMSVVNLEAFAMSQGIDKAYSSMTQAEQAALRYNYLLQATAGAQGDFARTSGSYANQIKIFEQNVQEIKAGLGDSLLDFITPALTTFNEWYASLTSPTVKEQMEDVEDKEQDELLNADIRLAKANALIDIIEELQQKTELSEYETVLWEKSLKELVTIFPELARVIDLTNMSIKGTPDDLRKATDQAWQSAREMAKINALKEKEQIRANALQAYADKQIAYEMKKAEAEIAQNLLSQDLSSLETDMTFAEIIEIAAEAEKLKKELEEAKKEYEKANDEYEKAVNLIDGLAQKHEEMAAAEEEAAIAQAENTKFLKDQLVTLTDLADAWQKVSEYRSQTQATMRSSLERGTDEMWDVVVAAEAVKEVIDPLQKAQDMLVKNTAFYEQYRQGLQAAAEKGLDSGLIAELAQNQTAENKALLDYIRNGAKMKEIDDLNAAWTNLGVAKDSLADTMTDAVLKVDEGYTAMLDAAYEATEQIDQYEITEAAAASTAQGIVDGLNSVIPQIYEKAAEINAIMEKIGAGGVSLDFGEEPELPPGDSVGNAGRGSTVVQVNLDSQSVGGVTTPYISGFMAQEVHRMRFGG